MSSITTKKRKPKALKRNKKPLVPKWKLFRANEPLLSVFMWGVNHSVNELSHVPPPMLLMPDDFKAFSKIKIDNHGFNKENMPSHFKFKEYCPNVFRNLRDRFGVDEIGYMKSLSYNQPEPGDSPGRSNARFWLSWDYKFVVKTLTAEDIAEIHSILKGYHEFVVEKHGKTLLPQYLGMYRLTVDGSETYLVVMRNIFGRMYPVHKKYDLKGSTVQRQASDKEKAKDLPTFKDNDFLEDKCKLFLPDEAKEKLVEMLHADTAFLCKLHLMDYSLLVGIHDVEKAKEEARQAEEAVASPDTPGPDSSEPEGVGSDDDEFQPTPPDSPIPSTGTGAFAGTGGDGNMELDDEFYAIPSKPDAPTPEIYFIGLVDILTYYGVKKKTASAAKSVKYGSEAENISTVKPKEYGKRLLDFVTKAVSFDDG